MTGGTPKTWHRTRRQTLFVKSSMRLIGIYWGPRNQIGTSQLELLGMKSQRNTEKHYLKYKKVSRTKKLGKQKNRKYMLAPILGTHTTLAGVSQQKQSTQEIANDSSKPRKYSL